MKLKQIITGTAFLLCGLTSGVAQTKKWSLEDCIQYAITHNIEIQQQLLTLQEAAIDIKGAKGAFLPNLQASANNAWNNGLSQNVTTGVLQNQTTRNSSYGFNSNVPLFTGFRNYHQLQQAKLQQVAAQFNIDKSKDDLMLQVANAFLEVLLQKENVAILENQYQLTQEQLQQAQQQVEAGTLAKGEVLQLEATAANDVQRIAEAENSFTIAKLSLKRLLNLELNEEMDFKEIEIDLDDRAQMERPIDSIVTKVLKNRNELKWAELNIQIAEKGVEIAKSAYFPTLTGFLNFDTRESDIFDISYIDQLKNNYGWVYGFQLNIPIFNRFQTQNAVAKSKINVLKSQYQLKQSQQRITQDVYEAYLNAQAMYKTFLASEKNTQAQQLAFEYQQTRFDVGQSNLLDYTQTKINYQRSQTELLRVKYNLLFRLKILDLYYHAEEVVE
ncbi:TolC family protein [Ochrovirga pacifica]|uniref:TolC family protein n=1 Tax=Ochrovirga pacifica TaxID=1042376 RepID=UPI0002D63AF1|nr:TolC family protein [Ochrovirga pacifica]